MIFALLPHQVVKYRPNDKDARTKYVECNKLVKQQAFERAISVSEEKKSVLDSINLENMSKSIQQTSKSVEQIRVLGDTITPFTCVQPAKFVTLEI